MPNKNRFSSKRAGSSLAMTLMFLSVIALVTLAAVGVSTTNDSMAQRAVEKSQANALAESGVQMLYDQLCRDAVALKSPTQTITNPSVCTVFAGRTRIQGGYAARVVNVDSIRTSPAPGYSAGSVQYIDTYLVEGTGTAKNGTTSITQATFRLKRVYSSDGTPGGPDVMVEFPGAINSNTDIQIVTNGGVRTLDNVGVNKAASMVANNGITWSPYSGVKTSYVNPNLIDVQGQILVPNQPDSSVVDFTRGVSGLGNPNGTKNYTSANSSIGSGALFDAESNDVTGMGQPKYYPGYDELVQMRSNLLAQAQNAPYSAQYGSISSSTVPIDSGTGMKVIKAPAVINGNLIVNSNDAVALIPRSTNIEENIIYVTGDVANVGELANMGVKLVILGQYRDSKDSIYKMSDQGSPYGSLAEVYKSGGLLSLNQRQDAISISSDISSRYGNIYAAAGGIVVTGCLEINGILTSGGPREYTANQIWNNSPGSKGGKAKYGGGVQIRPDRGGTFCVSYVREAKEFRVAAGGGSNGVPTLLEPIRSDKLADWHRIR